MASRITVAGCGYVGLTTGVCFAHLGHEVVCTDVDADRVEQLNRGEAPILEAGLDNLLREGVNGGRLRFVVGTFEAAAESEFVYLCVPTPQGADGSADLSYIEDVAREIGPHLQPETIVVNKSTVPVGSTRVVEQALGRSDVYVVSNPEFLREGSAVHDFLHPDRIVIGADDQAAAVRVASLYLGVAAPLIVTDPPSAELIKYASNAFLATKVSFVNAVAAVCEAVGADMNDVVLGMGYDKRIGHEFLRPGPGWGGSCFVGTETVLVRRDGRIRLLSFEELWREVADGDVNGWEVLSWREGAVTPEFERIERFTARPYQGDLIDIRTKTGRMLATTADHDYVVRGRDRFGVERVLASELSDGDLLPIAVGLPVEVDDDDVARANLAAEESDLPELSANGSRQVGPVSRSIADGLVRRLAGRRIVAQLAPAEDSDRYYVVVDPVAPVTYDDHKNAVWDRIVDASARPFDGWVYSVEVRDTHTVVTSFGLVCGNCFPKDSRALIRIAEDAGYDFDLLEGVVGVNNEQFDRVAQKAIELVGGSIEGKQVAAWGLTFKARTDDLRESPALEIIRRMQAAGAKVRAFDPSVSLPLDPHRAKVLDGIDVSADPYAACQDAEVLLVLTEWDEFRWLDFDKVAQALAGANIVDGRNILDRESLRRRGFEYRGIGRT